MTRRSVVGLLTVVALLVAALVLGSRHPGTPATARVSSLAPCPAALSPDLPKLTLDCLGGGPRVRVAAGAPGTGRPYLLNVWATWCPPCRQEIPYLVALRARAAGRLDVVGVLTEDEQRLGLRLAAEDAIRYPSVVDPDGTIMRSFPPGPPTTLFVDAAGRVVFRHGGAFHSEPEIERLVADHLGLRL